MGLWRLGIFISCWVCSALARTESFLLTLLRNLQAFNSLILGNVPLFQTETILTAPEIILHPNSNEINKMCVHCVRNCVEVTKVRRGCLRCCTSSFASRGWARLRPTAASQAGRDRVHFVLCPDCCPLPGSPTSAALYVLDCPKARSWHPFLLSFLSPAQL